METRNNRRRRISAVAALIAAVALLAACSISTDSGKDKKNVQISTLLGNMKIKSDDKNPPDTGMAVYPGAKVKPGKNGGADVKIDTDGDAEGNSGAANVNIDSPFFGLKVAAATYTTDDPQAKVLDFYRNELKKFGSVIECQNGKIAERKDSNELYCQTGQHDHALELAVGTKERRRMVAFKPVDKGTEFSLVYVALRGKESDL